MKRQHAIPTRVSTVLLANGVAMPTLSVGQTVVANGRRYKVAVVNSDPDTLRMSEALASYLFVTERDAKRPLHEQFHHYVRVSIYGVVTIRHATKYPRLETIRELTVISAFDLEKKH